MSKTKNESFIAYLEKLNISQSRYKSELDKLKKLNYLKVQADCIILRRCSKKTVEKLIELHHPLQKQGFTHDDLVKIAARDGGSNTLQVVLNYFETLQRFGFGKNHILGLMKSHGSCASKLLTLVDCYEALRKLGFAHESTMHILAHRCGSKNLIGVKRFGKILQGLGFGNGLISRMVNFNGGAQNLQTVTVRYVHLKLKGFDNNAIAQIAGHNNGSDNLEAVIDSYEVLKSLGFDNHDIVQMVDNYNGSKNLKAAKEFCSKLLGFGFSHGAILRILSHPCGAENLFAMINCFRLLEDRGFDKAAIKEIVCQDGGFKISTYFTNGQEGRKRLKNYLAQLFPVLPNIVTINDANDHTPYQPPVFFTTPISCDLTPGNLSSVSTPSKLEQQFSQPSALDSSISSSDLLFDMKETDSPSTGKRKREEPNSTNKKPRIEEENDIIESNQENDLIASFYNEEAWSTLITSTKDNQKHISCATSSCFFQQADSTSTEVDKVKNEYIIIDGDSNLNPSEIIKLT